MENKSIQNNENPVMIFMYGPPASGKSVTLDVIKKKLSINDSNTVTLNFDDIIEEIQKIDKQEQILEECKKYYKNEIGKKRHNKIIKLKVNLIVLNFILFTEKLLGIYTMLR